MLSDNVSANGSDGSFFDPPIEYFRSTNPGNYGLDSGDNRIYMNKNKNRSHTKAESKTSASDFDASFANRKRQLTPGH